MVLPDILTEPEALLQQLHMDRYPGVFVTFEGIEGCGKSTQQSLLFERLSEQGYPVICTSEPGGTPIGEEIRDMLLRSPGRTTRSYGPAAASHKAWKQAEPNSSAGFVVSEGRQWAPAKISAATEALLYAASRAEHIEQVIRPALRRGDIVLCDRYIDSTLAYQGGGRELGFDFILSLHALATGDLFPDLTILLKLDASTALKRARRGGADRIEREKLSFHRRVYEAFERIEQLYPDRVVSVDASRSRDEIAEDVYTIVAGHLLEKGLTG